MYPPQQFVEPRIEELRCIVRENALGILVRPTDEGFEADHLRADERDGTCQTVDHPMYSATFTFAKGEYDEEFHRRDQAIAEIAKAIPGYLGEEAWENPATGLISTVYYWQTLEALQQLIEHPLHRAAKDLQGRWIKGYHITIAQVLRSYGDGGIAHPFGHASPARQE